MAELDALGGPGSAFVKADLSLMAASDAVVREYLAASGGRLDLLVLSPGIATFQGFTPTPEGVDVKMALHYYSRAAAALAVSGCFVCFAVLLTAAAEAAPALEAAGGACLFVLSGNFHSAHVPEDGRSWGLTAETYSLRAAADAAGFYTDAAMATLARGHPRVRWVHANPGFVASSWGTELPAPVRLLARFGQLFATSPAACAERLASALLAPPRGAFASDSSGNEVPPAAGMTEERRAAIWAHTTATLQAAGVKSAL